MLSLLKADGVLEGTDSASEQLIQLREIRSAIPWLPRLDQSTFHRWAQKGVVAPDGERVRLETVRIGTKVYTTPQAVERFIERTNKAGEPAPARPTAGEVERRVAAANRRLERRRAPVGAA